VPERLKKFSIGSCVFWVCEQGECGLDDFRVNQLGINPDYFSALVLIADALFTETGI
jgi:hypothetical protein